MKNIRAEIKNLTKLGLSDHQIGAYLRKHHKTIAYHRKRNGIDSGRSHKAELSKHRRGLTMNKRSYSMKIVGEPSPTGRFRHGLNALAPITCRGAACPYKATCNVPDADLRVNEPCVTESVIAVNLMQGYIHEFNIGENDIADLTRIRHLTEIEIKLMRCNRLTAADPELEKVVWGKDEQRRCMLNPIARYDLLLMDERLRIIAGLRAVMAV